MKASVCALVTCNGLTSNMLLKTTIAINTENNVKLGFGHSWCSLCVLWFVLACLCMLHLFHCFCISQVWPVCHPVGWDAEAAGGSRGWEEDTEFFAAYGHTAEIGSYSAFRGPGGPSVSPQLEQQPPPLKGQRAGHKVGPGSTEPPKQSCAPPTEEQSTGKSDSR